MSLAKTLIRVLILILLCFSCKSEKRVTTKAAYLRHVGDAQQDSLVDHPNFKICYDNYVMQYFNFSDGPQYVGEKITLLKIFKAQYKPKTDPTQNGSIRIRFIVNCEGHSGRFRILQADSDFKETKFNNTIVSQLLEITKGIKTWEIIYNEDEPMDYYMYLIFKIKDGHITDILP